MAQNDKMFTQSDLLSMGWSKGLIDKLLPKPILKHRGNSRSSKTPPTKLWYASTVYKQMRNPKFVAAKAKSAKRREAAHKAVATKEQKLIQRATELAAQLEITIIDDEELLRRTIENQKEMYRRKKVPFEPVLAEADQETMEHWVVHFIRHKLINYDKECTDLLYGNVGCRPAYIVFKKAILLRIAEAYPKYADACNAQYRTVHIPEWRRR